MSAAFEIGLEEHLVSKKALTPQDKQLLRVVTLPKSNKRRKRILGRIERAILDKEYEAKNLAYGAAIDWKNIDWAYWLGILAVFIKALLLLFL